MANNNKIERAAVSAVKGYLDLVDKFEPIISDNDKTPIIDGYFNIYKNGQQKVEDFFAQIPVQVKGTASDKDFFYRIGREHVDAYKQLGGIVFFKVFVDEEPKKILYAVLSSDKIDELQKQSTKDIKIDLNEAPTDPKKFETEIFEFTTKRNCEKVKNPSPKEIEKLVEGFEKIRGFLNEIEDKYVKIELELYLDSIKDLKDNGTIGWRDKFILYSRKAHDLAINHLKDHDFTDLQFKMGKYSFRQRLYHSAEYYYQKALLGYKKREDERSQARTLNNLAILHKILTCYSVAEKEYKNALAIHRELAETNYSANAFNVAKTLNNLAILHKLLTCYDEAEHEYQEALEIYSNLAEKNKSAYNANVATTFNNLGDLYRALNRYDEAEQKYKEALEIRRDLVKENKSAYIANVATTLNNLGDLYRALNRYDEAEQKYNEALKIRRDLAEENKSAYISTVATTLNSMGELHRALNFYGKAKLEYNEALKIRRELAKNNPDAYIWGVANTLNNIGKLHQAISRFDVAEQDYQEALEIYRELVKKNRDVYLDELAEILYNIASLRKDEKRIDEARVAANEALDIYKKLAKKNPQIWSKDLEKTQEFLNCINQTPNSSASTKD